MSSHSNGEAEEKQKTMAAMQSKMKMKKRNNEI